MSELEPCPFCGGYHVTNEGVTNKAIHCVDCGAYGPEPAYDTNEIDVDWNTRAAPKVKALEWSEGTRGYRTSGIMGENYEINLVSKGYDLWLDRDDQCIDLIGNYATLKLAKSGAQSYYKKQILEALE
jgi:hypothetical protein